VNTNVLTYADAAAVIPEGYDPEEGEYMDDEDEMGAPIVGPMPPQPE
jgi:hypothetical protein